jgi:uncharacterized delta-60 repeat protein
MQLGNGASIEKSPGDLDLTFATNGIIEIEQKGTANAIVSDKAGGFLLAVQENNRFVLSRYLPDGEKDREFQETIWNFEDGDLSTPERVLVLDDGNIVLIGRSLKDGIQRPAAVKFNEKGIPNLIFGRRILSVPENSVTPKFRYKFVDGCLQHGNRVLIAACHTTGISERPLSRVYCLKIDGELDETFGEKRGFIDIAFHDQPSYATDVQIQKGGSIIVVGSWRYSGKNHRTRTAARYTDKGFLDNTFGRAGYADILVPDESTIEATTLKSTDLVNRVAIQMDDKILIAGCVPSVNNLGSGLLARLDPNGDVDADFNAGSPLLISRPLNDLTLNALAVQPDGKIVAVGRSLMEGVSMQCYERVSEKGELENFWRGDSVGDCSDVTIQRSGRVVISGGSGASLNGDRYPRVWGRLGS